MVRIASGRPIGAFLRRPEAVWLTVPAALALLAYPPAVLAAHMSGAPGIGIASALVVMVVVAGVAIALASRRRPLDAAMWRRTGVWAATVGALALVAIAFAIGLIGGLPVLVASALGLLAVAAGGAVLFSGLSLPEDPAGRMHPPSFGLRFLASFPVAFLIAAAAFEGLVQTFDSSGGWVGEAFWGLQVGILVAALAASWPAAACLLPLTKPPTDRRPGILQVFGRAGALAIYAFAWWIVVYVESCRGDCTAAEASALVLAGFGAPLLALTVFVPAAVLLGRRVTEWRRRHDAQAADALLAEARIFYGNGRLPQTDFESFMDLHGRTLDHESDDSKLERSGAILLSTALFTGISFLLVLMMQWSRPHVDDAPWIQGLLAVQDLLTNALLVLATLASAVAGAARLSKGRGGHQQAMLRLRAAHLQLVEQSSRAKTPNGRRVPVRHPTLI